MIIISISLIISLLALLFSIIDSVLHYRGLKHSKIIKYTIEDNLTILPYLIIPILNVLMLCKFIFDIIKKIKIW